MDKGKLKKFIEDLQPIENRCLNSDILIIDGLNTFLRNFTMINHLNPQGNHIGGLVGFLKSIGYAIKLIGPTRVILVFDGPGAASSKKNLFPDYKSNRHIQRITNYDIFDNKEEEDESIANQINRLIYYLQLLPLDLICIDGLEADDIIGYLVQEFEKQDSTKKITVMSADKDFLQLVSTKTQIFSPVKKKFYQTEQILEEYKIHPNNFIILKTLLGDKSDNLPGVPGLGEKKLMKFFPELALETPLNLEEIYKICEVKKEDHKLISQVIERKSQLEINFKLMNLKSFVLSPENIAIIEGILSNTSKVLDKHKFLIAYHSDLLGDSIQNTSNWLEVVFRNLQNFR